MLYIQFFNLKHKTDGYLGKSLNIFFYFPHEKKIWGLECSEGVQHKCSMLNIKANYIKKIFIDNTEIKYAIGVLGLLASFALTSNVRFALSVTYLNHF